HQGSNGAEVVIYGANAADFVPAQFNAEEHTQLGKGTLSRGRTAIDLDEDPTSFDSVIIWVKELPKSDKVDLTEVQLTGVITGTASTDNPEEAVSEEE
ncbi:hypothetical protein, partial [Corynebacterium casei]